jgi:hypothetical protein
MPVVNRAPFDALVDDDGSGLTGTLWNKAAIAAAVMDPMSLLAAEVAAYPLVMGATLYFELPTGTYHDLAPGARTVWMCQPTTGPVTITGIADAGKVDGMAHLFINAGAYAFTFSNQDAGSAAGNRITCPAFANYSLGVWRSIWFVWSSTFGCWVAVAP